MRSGDAATKNRRTKTVYKAAKIENGGNKKERRIYKMLVNEIVIHKKPLETEWSRSGT